MLRSSVSTLVDLEDAIVNLRGSLQVQVVDQNGSRYAIGVVSVVGSADPNVVGIVTLAINTGTPL